MSPGRQLSKAVLSAEGSVSSCHTAPMTPCHRRMSEHFGASASCASRSKRLLVPAGPEEASAAGPEAARAAGPASASAVARIGELGQAPVRHRGPLNGIHTAKGAGAALTHAGEASGAVGATAAWAVASRRLSPCWHADAQRALGRHVLDVGEVLDGDTPPSAPEGHQRVRLTRLRLLQ